MAGLRGHPFLTFGRRAGRHLVAGFLACLVGAGLGGRAGAAPAGTDVQTRVESLSVPRATSARIEKAGSATRIVFDIDRPVAATSYVMAAPDRIVVDLPEVDFRISPQVGLPAGLAHATRSGRHAPKAGGATLTDLVRSFRFGLFAPGRSRIVVDLAGPARLVRTANEKDGAGRDRLVIELARTDAAAFRAAAQASERRLAAASKVEASDPVSTGADNDSRPLVVLDAGHGGIDTGALGPGGVEEKNITFAFVQVLKAKLEASGRYRVLLTRNEDVYVPLSERVRIARRAGAALFISIHADTLSDDRRVSGATIYTLSERASDAEAARIAAHENAADSIAGVDDHNVGSDVTGILADLTRRETRTYSHTFARSVVSYWRRAGHLNKNPQRSAGFVVLKAPDVPSILLELGYLSNRKDVHELTSPEWREKAAASVAESIDKFFSLQPSSARRQDDGTVARLDSASSPDR